MSYDLIVASEKPIDVLRILGQLRAQPGVQAVKESSEQLEVSLTLPNGNNAIFFIGMPLHAQPEDFDDAVFEYVRNPQWLTELTVPAHAGATGVELARQAAILIAKASKGAAVDLQDDDVLWPPRKLLFRTPRATNPSERDLDILSLSWIVALPKESALRSQKAERLCASYLEQISANLSAATPVRCGTFEPFQGRGPAGFEKEWSCASQSEFGDMFHFTAKPPCFGGHVKFSYPRHSLESPKHSLPCLELSLNVDASHFSQRDSENDLIIAFAAMADKLNAVYGAVHYLRGWEYFRGQLWARQGTESSPQLTRSGWIGIPPSPAWIVWFNNAYLAEMPDWSSNAAQTAKNGRVFKFGEHPCPVEKAALAMPPLPEALRFSPAEETVTGHNPGAQPAARILAYEDFFSH